MSDAFLGYQNPTVVDKKLDVETVNVAGIDVERERVQVTGRKATDIAPITVKDGLLVNLAKNASDTFEVGFAVSAAGSGDVIEIVGSATKIVRILEIFISEPSVAVLIEIIRRSSLDSSGTTSNPDIVPLDTGVSTALVKNYTAAPTLGTAVGTIFRKTLAKSQHIDKSWVEGGGQAPTLRSATTSFCVNVGGAVNFDCYIRWIESSE